MPITSTTSNKFVSTTNEMYILKIKQNVTLKKVFYINLKYPPKRRFEVFFEDA